MKKLLFWILLPMAIGIGFCNYSFSQSTLPKTISDSLWGLWSNPQQPDTLRNIALRKFIWDGYLFTQPDSAFYFANLQYNFSLENGLKKYQADALNTQGVSYSIRNNYAAALDVYLKTLTIREDISDKPGMASTQANLGITYYNLGYIEQAIDAYKMSMLLYEELGNKKGLASSSLSLADILYRKGEMNEALVLYTHCALLRKELGNKAGQSVALLGVGRVYNFIGDYSSAIYFYKQSLELSREIFDERSESLTAAELGIAYWNNGDFARALECHEHALNYSVQTGDQYGISLGLNNVGTVYLDQGDYQRALESFSKSLKICEEMDDQNGVSIALNNIGVIYKSDGNYSEALKYYTRSNDIAKTTNDKYGRGNYLSNIGTIYALLKQYDTALNYFEQSLSIRQEIQDQKGAAIALNNIGIVYEKKYLYLDAIRYQKSALKIAVESGLPEQMKDAARSLINIYYKTAQIDSAKLHLDLLIDQIQIDLEKNYFTLSENQKELYFSIMEKDFGKYYDFTLFHQKLFLETSDEAYNLALQNKGITLKSSTAMRSIVFNSNDSLLISDYDKWIQLKQKIAGLYSTGKDTKLLEEEAIRLEKNILKKSNAFSDFEKIKSLNWKNVQASLLDSECAIEFVNFESEIDSTNPIIYAAFLVRKDSKHPEVIKLCTEEELKNILGVFQGNNLSFIEKVYGKKSEAKTALYEKIWQPLEPFLKDIKTVYYSPSGLLHKISFSAICKEQDIFLSDVYNFRQVGSTGNIAFEKQIEFGDLENFLLMGGVNYNSDSTEKIVWDYLPGSLSETNSINNYLQKKKFGVNYFKENNASESIFKEKIVSSSIVHIATHGFFFPDPQQVRAEMKATSESNQDLKFRGTTNYANWSFVSNKNPLMRSGIVLANANDVWSRNPLSEDEDGIVTAQEVSNLDLRNTKLVVLSACETGLGDIKGSEGVFGLQRAFKMAGVKYLIMSLWQVPDKETSEFMILFYKNLIKLKDIPTAFQKTQKVMREKYDPYYWGAFVLIE